MEANNDSEVRSSIDSSVESSDALEASQSSESASQIESVAEQSAEEGLSMDSDLASSNSDTEEADTEAKASEMFAAEAAASDTELGAMDATQTMATQSLPTGDTGLADERGDPLTHELAREVFDDAVLSMDSYNDEIGQNASDLGYSRMTAEDLSNQLGEDVVLEDPDTGFSASVYQDEEGNVTVAYRGSEADDLGDIRGDWLDSNFGQAFGNEVPESYQQASELAEQMKRAFGDDVQLTGHSLGGGMANYAAIDNNLDYNAFNAAGLSNNTVDELGDKVDAYSRTGNVINDEYDPLTNYGGKYNDETWGNNAQHIGEDNLVFLDNNNFNWFDTAFNFGKRVQAHNLEQVLPTLANAAGSNMYA